MAEKDTSAEAGRLAEQAVCDANGDYLTALLILMQAASALCISRLRPAAFAADAFRGAAEVSHERLVEVLGLGEVRQ